MDRCQPCQSLLLDYLYDLLDGSEQVALEAHVAGCAACQDALALARRQQDLLAAAARLECAPVHFEMPSIVIESEAAPLEEPAILPLPVRPQRPRRAWLPWAAAAALLAITGIGAYLHHDRAAAHDLVQRHQEQWEERAVELAAVYQRAGDVAKQLHQQRKTLADLEAQELRVRVTGPQVIVGQETAPFQIEATDLAGKKLDAQVVAKLVRGNESKEVATLMRDENDKTSFRFADKAKLDPAGDYRVVVEAERAGGARVELPVSVEVAARQFVTYLTTDRPVYEAGTDVLHFRSLTLDRRTLQPVTDELLLQYVLHLPGGQEVTLAEGVDRLRRAGDDKSLLRGPDGKPLSGIGAGSVPLAATLPAGEYTLAVRELRDRIPETRTRFLVRKATAARLETGWQWHRSEYRPGEAVVASARLVRASGEPLRNQAVSVAVLSAGRPVVDVQKLTTDATGRLHLQTRLPQQLAGLPTVALSVTDGDSRDELRTPLPIHLPGAVVEFYPEGGDLVAGLESRVYFQARDRRNRPVALRGEVLENDQPTGQRFQSVYVPELGYNSGLGSVTITPRPGATYTVRIDQPSGTERLPLPAVQADGVVLSVAAPVGEAGQTLAFRVTARTPRPLQVTLTCRGEVLEVVRLRPGQTAGQFTTRTARGVCRVTVHEERAHAANLVPCAERLVFCRPVERLNIDLRTDRLAYRAGDTARVQFSALNEFHRTVPAVAQVAIVDRAAFAGVDEKLVRSLPAQAWLANELRSPELLERADALLLPASASRQALDLVLATQGWRRFTPAQTEQLDEERLVAVEARRVPDYAALAAERRRVEEQAAAQTAVLTERADELKTELDEAKTDPTVAAALARLAWYDDHGPKLRRGLLLALGTLLVVALLVVLGRILLAELRGTPSWLALAGGVAAVLLVGLTVSAPPTLSSGWATLPENLVAQVVEKPHQGKEQAEKQQAAKTPDKEKWAGPKEFAKQRSTTLDDANLDLAPGGGKGSKAAEMAFGRGADYLEKRDAQTLAKPGIAATPQALTGNADKKENSAAEELRRAIAAEAKGEQAKDTTGQTRTLAEQEQALRQRVHVVRSFANGTRKQTDNDADRAATPTVFWHPVLLLPGEGTTIEFRLGANPTRYRIDVQAHSLDGRVGNVRKELESLGEPSK